MLIGGDAGPGSPVVKESAKLGAGGRTFDWAAEGVDLW